MEGTIAQGVHACGLRRTPCMGQTGTHLAHLMTAATMNVVRLLHWMADASTARTRLSAVAWLHQVAA